jgi:hypothetical protein
MDTAVEILKARRLVWAAARLAVKARQLVLVEWLLDLDELLLSIEATAAAPSAPARRPRGRPPKSGDRPISIEEAARRLKKTPRWVYDHRGEFPRIPGRSTRFSERGIEQWRRQRAASPAASAAEPEAPSGGGTTVLVAELEGGGQDGAGALPDQGA